MAPWYREGESIYKIWHVCGTVGGEGRTATVGDGLASNLTRFATPKRKKSCCELIWVYACPEVVTVVTVQVGEARSNGNGELIHQASSERRTALIYAASPHRPPAPAFPLTMSNDSSTLWVACYNRTHHRKTPRDRT